MVIAGGLAGAAGSLFAVLVGFVSPESFGLSLSILFIAMVVIGGLGSNLGAVVGVVVMVVIDERLRSQTGGVAALSYGILIMTLVVVAPGGLAALVGRLSGAARLRRRCVAGWVPEPREETGDGTSSTMFCSRSGGSPSSSEGYARLPASTFACIPDRCTGWSARTARARPP